LKLCNKCLKQIEGYYERGQKIDIVDGGKVMMDDCVLFSLLQFAKELYGTDLLAGEELPMLRTFYEAFEKRESARIGEGFYPEGIKALSRQCIEA